MKQAIKLASIAIAVTALASLAVGQETRVYREGSNWVQEMSGSLASGKNLRVKLAAGSVKVQGGSQSGITYVMHRRAYTSTEEQARRQFESYRVSALVKGDTAWIVAETGGGSIEVGSAGGDVSLRTGGGSIKIKSAKGSIKAESGGGSLVVLSGLQGAVLETGAGSIRVEKCSGTVKATTGGGSVDLGDIGGPTQIETGAGSIRMASSKGSVRAQTGGGTIQLDGATSVHAETPAGGIIVKLLSGADHRTDSSLETSAGDITVYLASDLAISIRAEIEIANGHTIRSDFPDIHVSTQGDWGPKTVTAEGQLNGGGPVLKVRTNSGNVNFRRVSQ